MMERITEILNQFHGKTLGKKNIKEIASRLSDVLNPVDKSKKVVAVYATGEDINEVRR